MFDKILNYIFTPPQSGKYKYVDPSHLDLSINPIPEGYTIIEPSECCNNCILYDRCPDYSCRAHRMPTLAHWPGKAMLPAYPIDYPKCKYYTTIDEIIKLKEGIQS